MTTHFLVDESGRLYCTRCGLIVPRPARRRKPRPGSTARKRARLIARLRERDGDACALCGEPLDEQPTIEHLVPYYRLWRTGKANDFSNLALAHDECNQVKGRLTIEEWRKGG